jgi:hypothetical protein
MLIPVQIYKGSSKEVPEKRSFDPISLVFSSFILEISRPAKLIFRAVNNLLVEIRFETEV